MGIVAGDVIVGLQSKGTRMKFTQYYLDCLSHASYLIGDESTGRAVVIDPQRDIAEYLADAEAALGGLSASASSLLASCSRC